MTTAEANDNAEVQAVVKAAIAELKQTIPQPTMEDLILSLAIGIVARDRTLKELGQVSADRIVLALNASRSGAS